MTARETVYLDWNASAPASAEALLAASRAMEVDANPSSVHGPGRAARALIEKARKAVATLVGAHVDDVVFTSGGTEGLHLAAASALADLGGEAVVLAGAAEHEAALAAGRDQAARAGAPFATVAVDGDGLLDLAALDNAIADHAPRRPVLILQTANNETGVIQDVAAAAERLSAAGGRTVLDAVQTIGRTQFDMAASGADYAVASAHKFGGLKGSGAVIRAGGRAWRALQTGGGQESYARAGAENVVGIAAMGAAAAASIHPRRMAAWMFAGQARDAFETALRNSVPGVEILGANAPRMANVSFFAVPDWRAETAVIALDLEGYAVSAGAACTSGKAKPSHVAEAMGRTDLADKAVRVSFGPGAHEDEAGALALAVGRVAARARQAPRAAA